MIQFNVFKENYPEEMELRRQTEGSDQYPEKNTAHDARLVDPKTLLCYGILFGMGEGDRAHQEETLRRINHFPKLLETLETVQACLEAAVGGDGMISSVALLAVVNTTLNDVKESKHE